MFKRMLLGLCAGTLLITVAAAAAGAAPLAFAAQGNEQAAPSAPPEPMATPPGTAGTAGPSNPYYSVETIALSDGRQVDQFTIKGPPKPPPGYEQERAPVPPSALNQPGVASSLYVPGYDWVYGCYAVAAAMIGAYLDRNGFPDIYTGPTNGGVMPMDNGVWPTWTDGADVTYPGNPLAASRQGLDGRTTRGSIDDYWVAYQSFDPDPYIPGGWEPHAYGDAFGDYMKVGQSTYNNEDGFGRFFTWAQSGAPLTCAEMEANDLANRDAAYGRKAFYEARGYSVTACYNRRTDNTIAGGFSFTDYKAQIDAGRPVFLYLEGHAVVGVGYADPSTIYMHDTWDYLVHEMPWGGSYSGMGLLAAGIVEVAGSTPVPTANGLVPSLAAPGGPAFTLTVNGANFVNGSIARWSGSDRTTTYVNATQLTAAIPAADIATGGTASVTVFNPGPGGGASNALSFTVGAGPKVYLPLALRASVLPVPAAPALYPIENADGDGDFMVSWSASANATSYLLQEDDSAAFSSPETSYSGPGTAWNATGKAVGAHYYRVRASNGFGASGWSNTQQVAVSGAGDFVNGDFEAGATGWTQYSGHGSEVITQGFAGSVTAHSGSWAAWLGGEYDDTSYVEQQVSVPPSRPYLAYWHWIASADECGYDFAKVIVNGGAVVDSFDLCDANDTNGWIKRTVNLSALAGQSVSIRIQAETDSSLNSNLFVDDVAFQSTGSGQASSGAPDHDPTTVSTRAESGGSPQAAANPAGP